MVSLRSTRSAGTKSKSTAANVAADASADDDDDEYVPGPEAQGAASAAKKPVAKRPRLSKAPAGKSAPRGNKTQAPLALLPNVPLDVLFEVFRHLHPLDLLRLARTTKALRRILMRRSARFVWLSAIASVPKLPECPVDMAEPRYASLALETHCTYCLTPNLRNAQWECRVRICRNCFKRRKCFITLEGLVESARITVPPQLYKKLGHLIPCTRGPTGSGPLHFLVAHVRELCNTYGALSGDKKTAAAFLDERAKILKQVHKHAAACQKWQDSVQMDIRIDREETRKRRVQAIFAHLRELGYSRECALFEKDFAEYTMESVAAFRRSKFIHQPKDLTPLMWDKIRPHVLEITENVREERLAKLRHDIAKKRVALVASLRRQHAKAQPLRTLVIPLPDLCALPAVKALLDTSVGPDERNTVNAASFTATMAQVPALTAQWRSASLRVLLALLPAPGRRRGPTFAADPARLDLATALFQCKYRTTNGCSHARVFQARQLLWHRCMTPGHWDVRRGSESDRRRCTMVGTAPWNHHGDHASLCVVSAEAAGALVKLCGKDARTTTAEEMDALDARFACACCVVDGTQCAMSWRQAVTHRLDATKKGAALGQFGFTRLHAAHTSLAKGLEANLTLGDCPTVKAWVCRRCRDDIARTPVELRKHMRQTHNIDNVRRDDYYLWEDWFATPARPVRIAL